MVVPIEKSVLSLSQVREGNRDIRIDSRYFSQTALVSESLVAKNNPQYICDVAWGVRSFGAYSLTNQVEYEDQGIPFLRGSDYSGDFIDFAGVQRISARTHRMLYKSEIKPGMVLLSMSGSIGSIAVALESWNYPVNSNQDIAKILPKSVDPFYLAAFLGCKFGQAQIARLPVGSVQQHVFLWMIERIKIPRFSVGFEAAISGSCRMGYDAREMATRNLAVAEESLLEAIGLDGWQGYEPSNYTARWSDVFASQRMDARFFSPRIQHLLGILGSDGCFVGDVATLRRERFRADECSEFRYIEIGSIDGLGEAHSKSIRSEEAPSRAAWYARRGDIITSTIRPIRRLSASIDRTQDGHVCSSGLVVLEPNGVSSEVLFSYLRLPVVCELLDLYASASMYPAISHRHVIELPMPKINERLAACVTDNVRGSRFQNARSIGLLAVVKRAVEIAIEEGEDVAWTYLDHAGGNG